MADHGRQTSGFLKGVSARMKFDKIKPIKLTPWYCEFLEKNQQLFEVRAHCGYCVAAE